MPDYPALREWIEPERAADRGNDNRERDQPKPEPAFLIHK